MREEAEMKARIEQEYRAKAEAEAREKIEAEMRAEEEQREREREAAAAAASTKTDMDSGRGSLLGSSKSGSVNGMSGGSSVGRNGIGSAGARGLPLASPGGSSDGTDVVSLSARSSDGGGAPPFTDGRMLDDMEAEEMCSAITQIFLKKDPRGGTSQPFVLFNVVLKTNRRRWTIERRYSDFVWLHEVRGRRASLSGTSINLLGDKDH